jgi:hypothetical protein
MIRRLSLRGARKQFLRFILAGILLFAGLPALSAAETTVLLFIVDGLQSDAAKAAASHGAKNLKFLLDNGVWVKEAHCTSPAPRMYMPDRSLPWGTTTSPNVAFHTGTHVFESRQMDDIFLAARKAGIRSVFAGGAENYREFTTPDFTYYGDLSDSVVVQRGIDHFRKDGVRLLRLHLQNIRDGWTGPEDKTKPGSRYQQSILHADALLGKLIQTFKSAGVWDSTYVIVSSDHGMGNTTQSEHPASVVSSWSMYMNFYGPGIKKGAAIPYAETPDVALMVDYFLHLKPLRGHTDPAVKVASNGTTGTFLSNIFVGNPTEIKHPQFIRRYLDSGSGKLSNDYAEYRLAMLKYIGERAAQK